MTVPDTLLWIDTTDKKTTPYYDELGLAHYKVGDTPGSHENAAEAWDMWASGWSSAADAKMQEYALSTEAIQGDHLDPMHNEIYRLAKHYENLATYGQQMATQHRDAANALTTYDESIKGRYEEAKTELDPLNDGSHEQEYQGALAQHQGQVGTPFATLGGAMFGVKKNITMLVVPTPPKVNLDSLDGKDIEKFQSIHDALRPSFNDFSPFTTPEGGFDPHGNYGENPSNTGTDDTATAPHGEPEPYPATHAASVENPVSDGPITRVDGWGSAHIAGGFSSSLQGHNSISPTLTPAHSGPGAYAPTPTPLTVRMPGFHTGTDGAHKTLSRGMKNRRSHDRKYRFPRNYSIDHIRQALNTIPQHDYVVMAHKLLAAHRIQLFDENNWGHIPVDFLVAIYQTPTGTRPFLFSPIGYSYIPSPVKTVLCANAYHDCVSPFFHAFAGTPLTMQAIEYSKATGSKILAIVTSTAVDDPHERDYLVKHVNPATQFDTQDLDKLMGITFMDEVYDAHVEPLEAVNPSLSKLVEELPNPHRIEGAIDIVRKLVSHIEANDTIANSGVIADQLRIISSEFGSKAYGEIGIISTELYDMTFIELQNYTPPANMITMNNEILDEIRCGLLSHYQNHSNIFIPTPPSTFTSTFTALPYSIFVFSSTPPSVIPHTTSTTTAGTTMFCFVFCVSTTSASITSITSASSFVASVGFSFVVCGFSFHYIVVSTVSTVFRVFIGFHCTRNSLCVCSTRER